MDQPGDRELEGPSELHEPSAVRSLKWNQLLRIEETLSGAGGRATPLDQTGPAWRSASCGC